MSVIQIQFRRDTAANWSSANPVLAQGETGLDLTALRVKLGDGTTAWNSLAYQMNTLFHGAGAPSGTLGVNGDIYFDDTNKGYYAKAAGSWGSIISLIGATGPTGPTNITALTGDVVASGSGSVAATFGAVAAFRAIANVSGSTAAPTATPIVGGGTSLVGSGYTLNTTAPLTIDTGTAANFTGTNRTLAINAATTTTPGSMSAADKASLVNRAKGFVNILDFGADSTGATSITTPLNNAVAALVAVGGGILWFPPGVYLENSAPYVLSANNITVMGSGPNCTTLKTSNTASSQLQVTGYGSAVRDLMIQGPGTGTTSSKTAGIGLDMQSTEGRVDGVDFTYQWDSLNIGGPLVDADNIVCRYFGHSGIVVNHNSDHRISRITMDNAAATLPTGSGIDVQVTASLILDKLNVIHSNFALNLSPATGVTVPSIKATNCFFDTSAIGVRFAGAGSVFRSEFTNCWFSSMSTAGIYVGPTTAGNMVDGITFVNCDVYNNVAGTTFGINLATANYGKLQFIGCNVAGWTTGVATTAGAAAYPIFQNCRIGPLSAFGVNTTGINIGAGTYLGLQIANCDVTGNTTAFTLGAVTVTNSSWYRIMDNAGINPRGTVTTPTVPTAGTVVTNTTGFRVQVFAKNGATAPASVVMNGVTMAATSYNNVVTTGANAFVLDPGGTIAFTTTTVAAWTWIAN